LAEEKSNKINAEISGVTASISTQKNSLKSADIVSFTESSIEELKTKSFELATFYKNLLLNYEALKKEETDLALQLNSVTIEEKNITEAIRDLQSQLEENKKLQQERLSASTFASIEEIIEVLKLKLDVEKEEKEVNTFNTKLTAATNEVLRLEKETLNKTFDENLHQELLQKAKTIKLEFNICTETIGSLKTLIEQLQNNFVRRQKLLEISEGLQKKLDNLKIICSLFQGSKFVDYVSTIHLKNLCNAANERFFTMTGQKMQLEINDSNEFEVRDFMNGGKLRSVKTLSGGQTFQAALSLALALSYSIQSQAKSNKNFFFMDEGFGSLDKDSLSVVFDTLKSLKKENRIVGVISHLEELQQEINVFLNVENNEKTGSLIKESWR
jgi:DNA repair protein SbcC/Rad50